MIVLVSILVACLSCLAPLVAQEIEPSLVVGRNLIPNGDFSRQESAPWVSKQGTPVVQDGHLRVTPIGGEAKTEIHLGQGLSGRVLVYGGRVRVPPDGGRTADVFLYLGDQTYERDLYRVECRLEPREGWQEVTLVVSVPEGYVHTIIGVQRRNGAIEIDDWTARVR